MNPITNCSKSNKEIADEQLVEFSKSKNSFKLVQIFLSIFISLFLLNIIGVISPIVIFNVSIMWVYGITIIALFRNFRTTFFEYRFQKAMLLMLRDEQPEFILAHADEIEHLW